MTEPKDGKAEIEYVSRRNFLGAGSAAIATVAVTGLNAGAQTREDIQKEEQDRTLDNPGQENKVLGRLHPDSNYPPPTDHGEVGPIWYSFDLAHRRVHRGGWTRQVTERELPLSKDLSGVNMRLRAGAFREQHWHTANEWAYMLYGNARIHVLNPDGTVFIDDVGKGDLWYFPAGFPHSIQGLEPNGCEFLLVFDEGMFSEDNTFLLSDWLAHTPPSVLSKNLDLPESELARLPSHPLYIFPADLPKSLAEDRAFVGGKQAESSMRYTFKTQSMAPTKQTKGGEARVIDSHNFPASRNIAAAVVTLNPGGLRELHWHPNASEWQFYIAGKGRMTVFAPTGRARTMNYNANDVGFVPPVAAHYIENTGDTDLVFLEMFKANTYQDFSLNNWIRHMPPEMATAHLNLDKEALRKIPADKQVIISG